MDNEEFQSLVLVRLSELKESVDSLKSELHGSINALRDELRQEFRESINALRDELRQEFKKSQDEMRSEFKQSQDELRNELYGAINELRKEFNEFKRYVTYRFDDIKKDIESIKTRLVNVETRLDSLETRVECVETRQNEIYQVVRAIEHSNIAGKSELDSQNYRVAGLEGKLKKAARVLDEEISLDRAANL